MSYASEGAFLFVSEAVVSSFGTLLFSTPFPLSCDRIAIRTPRHINVVCLSRRFNQPGQKVYPGTTPTWFATCDWEKTYEADGLIQLIYHGVTVPPSTCLQLQSAFTG